MNCLEAKNLLQKWREENTRCSESIRDIWVNIDLAQFLGDESIDHLFMIIVFQYYINFYNLIERMASFGTSLYRSHGFARYGSSEGLLNAIGSEVSEQH